MHQRCICARHDIISQHEIDLQVEAFRRLYEVIGLGWVYAATRIGAVNAIADAVYDVWARFRLPITGRPALARIIEQRRSDGIYCRPLGQASPTPKCESEQVLRGKGES